jgi:hypothetical protein
MGLKGSRGGRVRCEEVAVAMGAFDDPLGLEGPLGCAVALVPLPQLSLLPQITGRIDVRGRLLLLDVAHRRFQELGHFVVGPKTGLNRRRWLFGRCWLRDDNLRTDPGGGGGVRKATVRSKSANGTW